MAFLEARAKADETHKTLCRLSAAVDALHGKNPAPVAQEVERRPSKSENPRKKRNNENNPLAHLKCAGCGSRGTMAEHVTQAPSGAYVRMLICGSCRNQSLMG